MVLSGKRALVTGGAVRIGRTIAEALLAEGAEVIVHFQPSERKAEAELGDKGRVLIRYSGTQPMCRVMVECPTDEITSRIANELTAVVKKCIG